MAKLVTEISVKDIDLVKNLIELLETHYDKLPNELKQQLNIISSEGINDFTYEDAQKIAGSSKIEVETNIYTHKILTVNKILRKVTVLDDNDSIKTIYPVDFYLIINGTKVIEWKGDIK